MSNQAIHEYKLQLLNALAIVVLYNRLRDNPGLRCADFLVAGRRRAYHMPS